MKKLILIIMLLLLAGCGGDKESYSPKLVQWHDGELNVTCWKDENGLNGSNLSCIPDWMLKSPIQPVIEPEPESVNAETTNPAYISVEHQIGHMIDQELGFPSSSDGFREVAYEHNRWCAIYDRPTTIPYCNFTYFPGIAPPSLVPDVGGGDGNWGDWYDWGGYAELYASIYAYSQENSIAIPISLQIFYTPEWIIIPEEVEGRTYEWDPCSDRILQWRDCELNFDLPHKE